MTSSTLGELSLLETLAQKLQTDISVSLLAELERELLRLRFDLPDFEWEDLCGSLHKRPGFDVLRSASSLSAVAADSFQARPSLLSSAAHIISAWEYSLPASRSLRARKAYFAREIADTIRATVKPRILILGAGRLNEANDALQAVHLHHAEFVLLDPDAKPALYPLRTEIGSWPNLSSLSPELGFFDLIYSSTWLDSTDDDQAAEWLAAAVEMLRAEGRLLAANFAPGSRDIGWTEALWNWQPHYRSEEDLAHLVMDLKNPAIRGHAVCRDESGASTYLEIHSI